MPRPPSGCPAPGEHRPNLASASPRPTAESALPRGRWITPPGSRGPTISHVTEQPVRTAPTWSTANGKSRRGPAGPQQPWSKAQDPHNRQGKQTARTHAKPHASDALGSRRPENRPQPTGTRKSSQTSLGTKRPSGGRGQEASTRRRNARGSAEHDTPTHGSPTHGSKHTVRSKPLRQSAARAPRPGRRDQDQPGGGPTRSTYAKPAGSTTARCPPCMPTGRGGHVSIPTTAKRRARHSNHANPEAPPSGYGRGVGPVVGEPRATGRADRQRANTEVYAQPQGNRHTRYATCARPHLRERARECERARVSSTSARRPTGTGRAQPATGRDADRPGTGAYC